MATQTDDPQKRIPSPRAQSAVDDAPGRDLTGSLPLWLRNLEKQPSLTDKFRLVKHHLKVLKDTDGFQVFALTAPHLGAGVSTCTSNLSLVMSWDFLDQRILLVDAHLKKPDLHLTFGARSQPGLLEYLVDGQDLSRICQPTFRPNLDLITGGDIIRTVSSPFDLKRFTEFLEDVRQHYEFVLVDCPPVLEASDAQVICGKVDGVVMVAEANRLRYEVLTASLHELQDHARLVGCILNKRQFFIPNFLYRFL